MPARVPEVCEDCLLLLLVIAVLPGCTILGRSGGTEAIATDTGVPLPTEVVDAEEWIEVDLATQEVILHRRGAVVARLAAATGVTISPEYETPAGVFDIHVKQKGPIENVPGVFVSDILIFDYGKGVGIHSRPMDAEGNLLDDRLGLPLTGGCVRVGDSAQVYDFAKLGMWVWIH
jgi:hypothetical protein